MLSMKIPAVSSALLSLIFLIGFISGCKDKNENQLNNEVFTKYPVAAGNYWEYEKIMTTSSGNSIPNLPDQVKTHHHVEVLGHYTLPVPDSLQTWEFIEYVTNSDEHVYWVKTYFTNDDTGFLYHANIGGSVATPVKNNHLYKWNKLIFSSIEELEAYVTGEMVNPGYNNNKSDTVPGGDEMYFEHPPVKSLVYPMNKNSEWIYREQSIAGTMIKNVVGEEWVSTQAGTFWCYKVQLIYSNASQTNIMRYDYISSKGLVKQQVDIKDVAIMDQEGNIIGVFDIHDEFRLTDYYISGN